MPLSRLGCPLSLKTPNMGNTGLLIEEGSRTPHHHHHARARGRTREREGVREASGREKEGSSMGVAWEIFTSAVAFAGVVGLVVSLAAVVYGASTKKWEGARRWGIATGVIWIVLLFVMGVDTVIVSRDATSRHEAVMTDPESTPVPVLTELEKHQQSETYLECLGLGREIEDMRERGLSGQAIMERQMEEMGKSESEWRTEVAFCTYFLNIGQ